MKKAFTMLELIMVIVVIGILAAVMLPRIGSDKLAEAATQVISHIRYTQHLAMVDDRFDASDTNWYKKRWQIIFSSSANTGGTPAYTIFSDTAGSSTGQPNISEMAVNPLDSSKVLSGGYSGTLDTSDSRATKKMNLGQYGVTTYSLTGGCSGARVAFDYLGRPIKGDLSGNDEAYESDNLIQKDLSGNPCIITLTDSSDSIEIAIEPETGYAHIL